MMSMLGAFRRLRSRARKARASRRRLVPTVTGRALEARVAMTASPYVIPLQPVPQGDGTFKLGIEVGLGGGAPKLYEFDTGGPGFWASYNPYLPSGQQWWGKFKVKNLDNLHVTYSSGNQYFANRVRTSVELYKPDAAGTGFDKVVGTTRDVDLAQIIQFANRQNPAAVAAWNQALAQGDPPLQGGFYGDFGASLKPAGTKRSNTIYSILPQIPMPEGLKVGFIVHMDPSGVGSYLQLGLAQSDLDSFATQLPMNRHGGKVAARFPVTGVPTYSEQVTTVNFGWSDPKTGGNPKPQNFAKVGWTIDTGAIPVNVWQGKQLKVNPQYLDGSKRTHGYATGSFRDGMTFTVSATTASGGQVGLLEIPSTGDQAGVNKVSAQYHSQGRMGRNYVNTGQLTFRQYDVMYDLTDGVIGFRPNPSR